MKLFEQPEPGRTVSGQAIWFGLWVLGTVIGLVLHPDRAGHGTHQQLGLPPCPSVLLFNRPCPGCGLTTSWSALLHGDFAFAFHAHPLGPLLYALFTASAFLALYGAKKNLRLITDSVEVSRFLTILAIGFVVFGFVRMARTPNFATVYERVLVGRE